MARTQSIGRGERCSRCVFKPAEADRSRLGRGRSLPRRLHSTLAGVDLVEDPAIVEVSLLRLCPTAEYFVDREELHRSKFVFVLLGHLWVARTIEVLSRYLLPLGR